jgi:hypothetical protein
MAETRWAGSWIWHPGAAVLAVIVAVVAFIVGLSPTLGDPPTTAAVVVAAGAALVSGFYLIVFAPTPTETRVDYKWWAIGSWLIGILMTVFVLAEARRPGGVLWPALILTVPWYYAVFRAIPPERASRPVRLVIAACVIVIGAAVAPFAWSGNSPTPPLDGAAIGYLVGIAVAAVFLRAGESWPRVAAALLYAVSFMSLTSQFLPIVPVLLAAYLAYWFRRRRIVTAVRNAAV